MGPYDEEVSSPEFTQRRMLDLEGRLLELESTVKTQRRMLVPVCLVTAGLALAFASFGLVRGGEHTEDLLGGWTALFFVYLLVAIPLTCLAVVARTTATRAVGAATWAVIGLIAVCMGAGPRGALAAVLGIGPWYLLGAAAITTIGLVRLPPPE